MKRILILIISLFGTLSLWAQIDADKVINIGRNVLSMDDYLLSIHYFNLAAKAKPYLAEPYYYRALAKVMLEDYRGAEADATMAIERNKFLTEAYRVRGFARLKLERDSLALLDLDKGLEYKPIDRDFLYYKIISLSSMKRYDDAKNTIKTLLRYYPGYDGVYAVRARINLLEGDTIASLADIDTATVKDKNDPGPYLMRAEISAKRSHWSQASSDLDAAISIMPQTPDLYLNRAYVRYNADDYFGAMSDYNYILELEPSNLAARYNRALLLYEVRDLKNAVKDFTEVLKLQPDNFHAIYARALINFDLKKWNDAIKDLHKIVAKYPRFHQGYYALAYAYSQSGNQSKAIENYNKAENLVRLYVTNPKRNPLDKPTISAGVANVYAAEKQEGETDSDVMERFNQLVTSSSSNQYDNLTYQESIKGKVQDRQMRVEPIPLFTLTPFDGHTELRPTSNYSRELMTYNESAHSPWKLFIGPMSNSMASEQDIEKVYNLSKLFTSKITSQDKTPKPVDYFNRGVSREVLKDFSGAIADFDSTLSQQPDMTLAYIGRSTSYAQRAFMHRQQQESNTREGQLQLEIAQDRNDFQASLADLDKALALNPGLVYAWFNKGTIYYAMGDFTSALECYNRVLQLRNDFAEAYYNRALTYMSLGNRESGRSDLSKAGELGILPSYSLLKRMQ